MNPTIATIILVVILLSVVIEIIFTPRVMKSQLWHHHINGKLYTKQIVLWYDWNRKRQHVILLIY